MYKLLFITLSCTHPHTPYHSDLCLHVMGKRVWLSWAAGVKFKRLSEKNMFVSKCEITTTLYLVKPFVDVARFHHKIHQRRILHQTFKASSSKKLTGEMEKRNEQGRRGTLNAASQRWTLKSHVITLIFTSHQTYFRP